MKTRGFRPRVFTLVNSSPFREEDAQRKKHRSKGAKRHCEEILRLCARAPASATSTACTPAATESGIISDGGYVGGRAFRQE